jgi:broad specificity phosphatase PhoE
MHTTLFLVRNADTDFSRDRRVAGRRDIPLSDEGRRKSAALGERMRDLEVTEILASPLPRAVETAEILSVPFKLGVVRDPRLVDFDAGRWDGRNHADIIGTPEYQQLVTSSDPIIPGGERLGDARDRTVAAVSQALADNELGASIVLVSHAGPLRVLLAHYLGMNVAHFHRLRLSPASVSVVRFDSEEGLPRILSINCMGDPASALR